MEEVKKTRKYKLTKKRVDKALHNLSTLAGCDDLTSEQLDIILGIGEDFSRLRGTLEK